MSNDRAAIEAIIATAKTTGLVAYAGETQFAGWKDAHDSGAKIGLWLPGPDELLPFRGMTARKGKTAGQRLVILAFEIGDDEQPIVQDQSAYLDASAVINSVDLSVPTPAYEGEQTADWKAQKAPRGPFAVHASQLHKNGWFFAPRVLEAIGTDDEFRHWIRCQSCVVCGNGDLVEPTGDLKCEAAHVNRPNGDSGLGRKAVYSCVPLCHVCHALQHQHGVPHIYMLAMDGAAIYGPAFKVTEEFRQEAFTWLDKKRNEKLKEWAALTLKQTLGYSSMTLCPPEELYAWANAHGIADTLPACYKP